MPSPNQVQAQNILRRIAQDPMRVETLKVTKSLLEKSQSLAQGLTIESLLHAACAANPDDEPLTSVLRMGKRIVDASAADTACREIFRVAREAEEQRLGPYDAACASRLEQIQAEIDQAHRDHRGKLIGQDREETRWRKYADKGLVREEILKLGIPEPTPGRDLMCERNQWAAELEQLIQGLNTEAEAIIAFKYSRNENALPATVLALVEGEK